MKYLLIPVVIIFVFLGACKKDSDGAVPDTHGHFMFVNAVPGSEIFSVRLDSLPIGSLAYGENSGYKTYRAQKYNVIITANSNPNVILYNQELFLRNNRFYSAYLGADSTNRGLWMFLMEDDLTPAPDGQAKFRVMDFSQAFNANRTSLGIDVYSDTSRFFRGLTAPSFSGFAPLFQDSIYQLNFRPMDSSRILKTISFPTQTGKIYTLITTGYPLDPARFNTITVQHN
ncbi:DUF4397 domain-containing protein [Chitinophaga silvatica]|uniref:DUF4397 domain-containing protein n=1 Tax=Chitinophaga silvatica TaxID=2282649 RepID=A0A3E1Y7F8_9BACT|nr:DUF4397 domain-containing protein [Chitinophaga silvatica]RFS21031.1 DUF4397 domain-containing protein [Chitinophaga silvatica]